MSVTPDRVPTSDFHALATDPGHRRASHEVVQWRDLRRGWRGPDTSHRRPGKQGHRNLEADHGQGGSISRREQSW